MATDFRFAHALLLRSQVLEHLVLDRKAVTVPARDVGRIVARHGLKFDNDVLEDLVQRVADMNVAVGVGRAVVQDKPFVSSAVSDRAVQAGRLPARELRGFLLCEVGLHGEASRGEIQRVPVCLGGVRHA